MDAFSVVVYLVLLFAVVYAYYRQMASPKDSLRATQKPRIIRPMSCMEVYHSALHVLRHSCGTVVACRYTLPPPLTQGTSFEAVQEMFLRGLALTVLENPLLQVGILNEDSPLPSWIELDHVDLGHHVAWETVEPSEDYDARLREAIRYQLDTWFEDIETKPGWRISVVRREGTSHPLDVVFSWNHTNLDGVAGKMFHDNLLRNLNDPRAQETISGLDKMVLQLPSVADRFPPPPESLRKIPISPLFAISTIWKELRPAFLVKSNPTHASWCPIREEPYRTLFHTFSLDDTTLKGLLQACRKHSTTITGLLHALPLVSLILQLQRSKEIQQKEVKNFYSITALDTRRFIPSKPAKYPWHEPQKTMDNEMSLQDHYFDSNLVTKIQNQAQGSSSDTEIMSKLEDIVWLVAARTRQEIQQKIDADMKNDLVGMMKFVKDWRVQKREQLKKPRVGAWGVSNIGVLDGGNDIEGWGIQRAVFQLSCEITSPVFHISAISVNGGELCVDVSWQGGVVEEAMGIKLARDMETWMRFLGGCGK